MNTAYRTGNRGMDEKIAKAMARDGIPDNLNAFAELQVNQIKDPRMEVAPKDERTYKDGTLFASAGEMRRWDELLKVQQAGLIKNLRRQVEFELQESFIHRQWGEVANLIYVADFTYLNLTFRKEFFNRECVEDSKGKWLTDVYKIKRKLFLHKFGELLFFEV